MEFFHLSDSLKADLKFKIESVREKFNFIIHFYTSSTYSLKDIIRFVNKYGLYSIKIRSKINTKARVIFFNEFLDYVYE